MTTEPSPVLLAKGLRRSYDDRVVVENFSAAVDVCEVVVLVGPNGCGKTTSIEMSLGLRRSDAGSCTIGGHDVRSESTLASKAVGVALQGASLNERVRVREHLEFFAALHGVDVQQSDLADRLGLDGQILGSLFGKLSGGQQRRVLVATALAGRPELAVLDEPTSGVDIESRMELWSALRDVQDRLGTAFLITTHDLGEAEQYADRVLVMRQGKIVFEGAPASMVRESGLERVVTLRSSSVIDREVISGLEAVELRGSPREVAFGFRNGLDVPELERRLVAGTFEASLIERVPTFEDSYLSMYGQDSAGHSGLSDTRDFE